MSVGDLHALLVEYIEKYGDNLEVLIEDDDGFGSIVGGRLQETRGIWSIVLTSATESTPA
jgi:hypothetical protein